MVDIEHFLSFLLSVLVHLIIVSLGNFGNFMKFIFGFPSEMFLYASGLGIKIINNSYP